MNHGLNLGVDVFYSGTVAAAREAAIRGIPAIALSADSGADRAAAAALGAAIALGTLNAYRRAPTATAPLFSVNILPGPPGRCDRPASAPASTPKRSSTAPILAAESTCGSAAPACATTSSPAPTPRPTTPASPASPR